MVRGVARDRSSSSGVSGPSRRLNAIASRVAAAPLGIVRAHIVPAQVDGLSVCGFVGGMQLRGIDMNLVVALRALLVHRNVTRAGKEVGLSQSSMSHALARLRTHFDDPLLLAVGRELVLTDRAKALIEPVTEAVARLELVFERPAPFDPKTTRRVFRIASTDNLELYVLPDLASTLQKTAPGIDVRVYPLRADWMGALQRGEIDLKLGRKYALPDTLESQELAHEQYVCVVRREHPAPSKLTIDEYATLEHLLVTPTAGPTSEPSGKIDAILAKHRVRRRIKMSVAHFLVAPFVVARSDLALTGPSRLLAPFIESLGLRKLELPFQLPGYKLTQVWAARSAADEAHRWLRDAVAKIVSVSPERTELR